MTQIHDLDKVWVVVPAEPQSQFRYTLALFRSQLDAYKWRDSRQVAMQPEQLEIIRLTSERLKSLTTQSNRENWNIICSDNQIRLCLFRQCWGIFPNTVSPTRSDESMTKLANPGELIIPREILLVKGQPTEANSLFLEEQYAHNWLKSQPHLSDHLVSFFVWRE